MIIPILIALVAVGLIVGDADSSSAPAVAGSNGAATGAGGSQGGSTDAVTSASEVGKKKPQVQLPKAPPPTELEVTDLVTGTGAEAKDGDVVTVAYLVLLQKNGKEVFSSWGDEPLSFELGGSTVTAGWNQGIEGMKEGGRRELFAPAGLSYGKKGNPPVVGPNEALVSVIDLLEVKPSPAPEQSPQAQSQQG